MLDPANDPFIEQVKADLAEGQAELERGERIPWHQVRANLEADAQQRVTERNNQPLIRLTSTFRGAHKPKFG